MFDGFLLKTLGEMFYLFIGLCAVYATWEGFRRYRRTTSTVIKTHITLYELQKMVESRSRTTV